MKITLTKVKHAKWASQETQCFDAVVCIDGVACIHAHNDGHGGCTFLRDMPGHKGSVDKLEAYADTLPPIVSTTLKDRDDPSKPFSYKLRADNLVDDLLYDWLDLKNMRSALKKRAMFKTGAEIREYNVTWETLVTKHAGVLAKVKSEYPDAVWLNALPEEEALKLWKEAAQ